jgi:L-seryl-tRNA(Ser) seleniumtransferase
MNNAGAAANLQELPSIDELLRSEAGRRLLPLAGGAYLTVMARSAVESIRAELLGSPSEMSGRSSGQLLAEAERRLEHMWLEQERSATRRVINATGVVIHTNLGRAPLSENARRAVAEEAAGYCTLEYDIESGTRGHRGKYAENLIAELTGAEAAIIVNNCAAAAFLVLTVFASGGEVVISRGELVEIGGDFRVPDVLAQSGAVLREVGTTNRTRLSDYAKAIGPETRMILRVHPSNYRIVGFTAKPGLAALAGLARENGVILYEDIGSGAIVDLSEFGLSDEPVVSASIRDGADIVSFSGDKLLGGPQSGIIAGRIDLIERVRKHPLYRALRVDKMIYAALEATLAAHRRGTAAGEIPVLRMLAATRDEIAGRTAGFGERLAAKLRPDAKLKFEISDGLSAVGGGAAPNIEPPTVLLVLTHDTLSASEFGAKLRSAAPPVIGRIEDGRVLLDLRTVSENEEAELLDVLCSVDGAS